MIKLNEDYILWAEKYEISLSEIECPRCKNKFIPDQPIVMKKYRGLLMSNHGCGEDMPFRVVPVDPETIALWNSLNG